MASSLSDLVNNLSEGIHRIKCKFGHYDKKCETCRIKYNYCECFLENTTFNDRVQMSTIVFVVTKIIKKSLKN